MGFYKNSSKGKQGHCGMPRQRRQWLFRCSRLILQLFCSPLLKRSAVSFIFFKGKHRRKSDRKETSKQKKSQNNLSATGILDGSENSKPSATNGASVGLWPVLCPQGCCLLDLRWLFYLVLDLSWLISREQQVSAGDGMVLLGCCYPRQRS